MTLDELRDLVAKGEVDTVVLAMTDMQGRLQGKRFDDLLLPPNRRALLITMALSTAAGVASALVGRQVQLDHFIEARPQVQEVRPTAREEKPQEEQGPRTKEAARD